MAMHFPPFLLGDAEKANRRDTLHEKAPAIILCQANIIASEATLKGHNDYPI